MAHVCGNCGRSIAPNGACGGISCGEISASRAKAQRVDETPAILSAILEELQAIREALEEQNRRAGMSLRVPR